MILLSRNRFFYIMLIACLNTYFVSAQKSNIKFEHLTVEDGLSQSTVTCILKDSQGFMWFGTQNGLNKYDGYEYTTYKHNQTDTTSISNNWITSIAEDCNGDLWIGTFFYGLNKFNKECEVFTNYTHNVDDQNSISNNRIGCLYVDTDSNLWIGTFGGGLCLYQKETNSFISYKHDSLNVGSIGSNYISSIGQDAMGHIWIANNDGYLIRFDQKNSIFTNLFYDKNYHGALEQYVFGKLTIDSKNNVWVGTENGIYIYDISENTFKHITSESGTNTINSNAVSGILEDENDHFWIATDHGGINIYDRRKNTFKYLLYNEYDNTSISNNQILSLYRDNEDNYWFGNFNGGINVYYKHKYKFEAYSTEPVNNNSLSGRSVIALCEDNQGNIWIGTDGDGLNVFNPRTGKFKHYKHNPNNKNSISSNIITSVFVDKKENIWIGTFGAGLNLFDIQNNRFFHYKHNQEDETSLSHNNVWDIVEDSSNNLWIGTSISLDLFNRKSQTFKHFENNTSDTQSFGGRSAMELLVDSKQNLWIGTAGAGADRYVREKNSFIHYKFNPLYVNGICNNRVNSIYEDSKGYIWFGTAEGLSRFDLEKNSFVNFTKNDGLADNFINGILEDNNSSFWISTSRGLSKFDPNNNTFKTYDISDGLPSNEFNWHTCLLSKSGKMYFGTPKGLVSFYPDSVKENIKIPELVFIDFYIFHKPVKIGEKDSPLKKHINASDSIILSYKQADFTIKYVALNYISPEKNNYAYMLEGFDKDWKYVGNERKATYTNLDPGVYKFKVKACNNDGFWNEEGASIKITITPPFWETWWFRILIFVLIVTALYITYYTRVRYLQEQRIILKKMVSERTEELSEVNTQLVEQNEEILVQKEEILVQKEALEKHQHHLEELVNIRTEELVIAKENAEESDRLKTAFLANMSHEIRTPMNAIVGFSQLLSEPEIPAEDKEGFISHINSNTNSLLRLLDDILNLSMIESNVIFIKRKEFDMYSLIEEVYSNGLLLNENSNLELRLTDKLKNSKIILNTDRLRVKQILDNLVNNACKFTEKGYVELDGDFKDEKVNFYVKDTGIGISKENLDAVFERFIKITDDDTKLFRGAGLGLAISKKNAELLGGTLSVVSELGKGSIFIFSLPGKVIIDSESISFTE